MKARNDILPGISVLLLTFLAHPLLAADPFEEFVRSADPKPAEEELKTFRLPPGFEIQLVAAEPDIAKPMNMAFDARGRLWITQSREYPYPAPLDKKGRDSIKILSDFGENGRAKKIETFAEGLNIPIGLCPYKNGVIAFSIPNIYFFQDTDNDGRADKTNVVLSRFGFEKDTHGMTSSFRRGYDGWLYADHGFNNDSTLTASDGSAIKMNSGNTYRFKIDGSRVEQFTWGQVNPFGLAFDSNGDLWSADCHSSPVYLLLRGAYYPSFGKPDDGLGFAPSVMRHSHGSTAISGIVVYEADDFPQEYRGNTFVGNVMTCRINRDSYKWHGSTPVAIEEEDFLRSDDSWFRPVDLQLGPDGALYVADFYNRIIGHYEVPLDHPGRDRERGRIWRIVYRGAVQSPNLTRANIDALIEQLAHPNITRRTLALNEITDRLGESAVAALKKVGQASLPATKIQALWALHRLGAIDEAVLTALAKDSAPKVRLHVMRILSEIPEWSQTFRRLAIAGLEDADAFVQRAAADALGQHPHHDHVKPLLALRHRVSKGDANLLHVVRMALRNQFKTSGNLSRVAPDLSDQDRGAVAEVAVAVPSPEAAVFLLEHLQQSGKQPETKYIRHVARHLGSEHLNKLAQYVRDSFANDLDFQLTLFKSVQEGIAQRGAKIEGKVREWGAELAEKLLEAKTEEGDWTFIPIEGAETRNPWFVQRRASSDGDKNSRFFCSLPPGGEHLTGTLRSKVFTIPERLTFYLAGHDGYPDKPPQKKNVVRLRAAESGAVLAERFPPRNDTAQPITLELAQHSGKRGYLEVTDGDAGNAYAWLAIGRFDPPLITIPKTDPNVVGQRHQSGAELAKSLLLRQMEKRLVAILSDKAGDAQARAGAAGALVAFRPNDLLGALAGLIAESALPVQLRESICSSIAGNRAGDAEKILVEAVKIAPNRLQRKIAETLAGSRSGAEYLLKLAVNQEIPATLLLDRNAREKIKALKSPAALARLEELTKELPPLNEELAKLVNRRIKSFEASKASAGNGAQLFAQHCAACHQIGGQGNVVGPQLDGVGTRGVERLCEDVLDPNRSVDPAFRTTLLVLKDGDVISGLFRRAEAEVFVLADSAGKEITVPKKDVAERRESGTSLMPDNIGELLSREQFNDLMAFLLSKGQTK